VVAGDGGGGGGGGAAYVLPGAWQLETGYNSAASASAGGAGGSGNTSGGGGGGGAGGAYLIVSSTAEVPVTVHAGSQLWGGAGGAGGASPTGLGGAGGSGGAGMITASTGIEELDAGSLLAGGAGGAGGVGGAGTGAGGAGGAGILGSSSTINNFGGTISGGAGGAGSTNGAGGAGIIGQNFTVVTSGTISGGLAGDAVTRASAITFTGGTNSLELQAGYAFTGLVVGTGTDTFKLGGSTSSSFAVSGIGAQYTGFSTFQKVGTSTWTLTGTTASTTPWAINQGTLAISNDNNLGAAAGGLSFGGGTLQVTAGVTSARTVTLNAGGGTVDTNGNTVALTGPIGGTGGLTKVGAGTLTLSAANSYSGGTTVTAGTLALTGSITSNVINAATFSNSGSVNGTVNNSATFNNNAAGIVSGRLTNTVGTTTNAGQLNGGATVTGGTLTTTGTIAGGLTNAATANANGGAINGAITNNAGTFNVGGAVTSDSTFGNASGATLAVGSAGNYTLQGMLTNSGIVTVASGGQLVATVGGITNAAGANITVAVGGTVKDDLNNAGTVTNNGAYVANVATNTGNITNNNVWTGNVASSAGTITNNSAWNGAITTSGTFNNSVGATVTGLVTNSGTGFNAGTLAGGLTTTGGTFNNTGTINGAVTVSGGTFESTGSTGALTIAGGASFAPGNGTPGTSTTINGNLAFQSGAFYLVQLNPTTSSFANVTGTATLGGATMNAVFANGSYIQKKYTILTAAGGVSGTFAPTVLNTNLPTNLHTTLSYDTTHAYLNLVLNFGIPGGLNGNQQGVGNALTNFFNSNGGIPLVYGSLTAAGLTQASGEAATGSQQTTFDAMGMFMGLLTDPFINGRGSAPGPATGAPSFAEESDQANAYAANGRKRSATERDAYAIFTKAPPAQSYDPRWSVWATGFGGSQTTDGNAAVGSNSTTSRIAASAVGADYRFSPSTIAGFALAGGGTNFSVDNGGTGRSDLFQAGAFIRHTAGAAYLSAALAYGWQDVTTDRTVTIGGADRLRAEFNANAWSGRLEGGYRFVTPWMGGFGLTPYAAAQFTTFELPAYAEQVLSGANTFALAYGAKSVTDSRSELGIRSDKSFAMQDGILTLRGRFAWAHDFNPDRSIAATFQALPGASFVVNGAAQAAESALTTASAEMKWLNGWSTAATFEGEFSNVTRSYAGKGVVRYAW
jgi:uncharacterized protein with beta-barrel porin domain